MEELENYFINKTKEILPEKIYDKKYDIIYKLFIKWGSIYNVFSIQYLDINDDHNYYVHNVCKKNSDAIEKIISDIFFKIKTDVNIEII